MKTIRILVLLVAVIPSYVFGDEGILVWRLEAKTGVTEKDIDSLSGLLTSEVEKQSGRKVISEADIATLLQGEEEKYRCGAVDTACMTEISGALGVPETVSGDLGRVGNVWILNLRRLDVRKVEVLRRVTKQAKGDVTAIVEVLPVAVAELFARELSPTLDMESVNIEAEKATSFSIPWMWYSFGTGAASVVFAGVATWVAFDYVDDYSAGDRDAKQSNRMWSTAAVVGYSLAGVALATGAILWFLAPAQEPMVSAAVGRDSLILGLNVRW